MSVNCIDDSDAYLIASIFGYATGHGIAGTVLLLLFLVCLNTTGDKP